MCGVKVQGVTLKRRGFGILSKLNNELAKPIAERRTKTQRVKDSMQVLVVPYQHTIMRGKANKRRSVNVVVRSFFPSFVKTSKTMNKQVC